MKRLDLKRRMTKAMRLTDPWVLAYKAARKSHVRWVSWRGGVVIGPANRTQRSKVRLSTRAIGMPAFGHMNQSLPADDDAPSQANLHVTQDQSGIGAALDV
jgi:predicted double-glycine peptidase